MVQQCHPRIKAVPEQAGGVGAPLMPGWNGTASLLMRATLSLPLPLSPCKDAPGADRSGSQSAELRAAPRLGIAQPPSTILVSAPAVGSPGWPDRLFATRWGHLLSGYSTHITPQKQLEVMYRKGQGVWGPAEARVRGGGMCHRASSGTNATV